MFRENLGRLLIVAAGAGCLVLLIFVVVPMLDEPVPSMTEGEIVAEVLGPGEPEGDVSEEEAADGDGVMPAPSPLVGVRNDGEEVAVIFPAASPAVEEPEVLPEEVRERKAGCRRYSAKRM